MQLNIQKAFLPEYHRQERFFSKHNPYVLFVLMLPFRVHREPAFQDTLALVEYFLDRPEGGEGENAEQGWDEDVADEQWTDDAQDA